MQGDDLTIIFLTRMAPDESSVKHGHAQDQFNVPSDLSKVICENP